MRSLPVLLARGELRVLQVGDDRPVLLVPGNTRGRMTTSDELLRKFAKIRRERDRLRRERAGYQPRRRATNRPSSTSS